MLEVLTLLSGLLAGPMELQVRVPPGTAAVEVRLDGERLVLRSSPPWSFQVPFPAEPRPAWLTIEALDASGARRGRLRRLVNLETGTCFPPGGKPASGATPLLIDWPEKGNEPQAEQLTGRFQSDGEALAVLAVEKGSAELMVVQDPAMRETFDLLSVGVLRSFSKRPGDRQIKADANDELLRTAVASLAETGSGADERGSEREDSSTTEAVSDPRRRLEKRRAELGAVSAWQRFGALGGEGRIHFVSPEGPPVAHLSRETAVFQMIGSFDAESSGPLWHLHDAADVEVSQRRVDAVAVAGWRAASSCRRRAVVLFESVLSPQASQLDPDAVMAYLEAAQVPFFVLRDRPWSDAWLEEGERPEEDPWQRATYLIPAKEEMDADRAAEVFERFQQSLDRALDRQRVVWLEGEHLPGEIEILPGEPRLTRTGRGGR